MNKHSWITISQADSRPLYLQVIEQIQRRISVGDLPAGTELPSIRQLAADLQVSVITIKRAYLELEREGIIATRHGKGSFVSNDSVVQPKLRERELEVHLDQAAELALLLGLSKTELQRRLGSSVDRAQGKLR